MCHIVEIFVCLDKENCSYGSLLCRESREFHRVLKNKGAKTFTFIQYFTTFYCTASRIQHYYKTNKVVH